MDDDTRYQTTPVLKRRNRRLMTPRKLDYGDPTCPNLDLSNKDEDSKLHGVAACSEPLGHLSIGKQHSTGKTDDELVVEKPSPVHVIDDDDDHGDDCVMIISYDDDDDKDKVYPKFQDKKRKPSQGKGKVQDPIEIVSLSTKISSKSSQPYLKLPSSLSSIARTCSTPKEFSLPEYSQDEIDIIEQVTMELRHRDDWIEFRSGCIEAASFMAVAKKNQDLGEEHSLVNKDTTSLVTEIMAYKYAESKSDKDEEERKMEKIAMDRYKSYHQQKCNNPVEVSACGLYIHPKMTFIGASPSAKVSCKKCGDGLLQIDMVKDVKEPWQEVTNRGVPSLVRIRSGEYRLRRDHPYFAQVQTQLAVTGRQWCDFYVYKETDEPFVERFTTDTSDMVGWHRDAEEVREFFFNYVVPELVTGEIRKQRAHAISSSFESVLHQRLGKPGEYLQTPGPRPTLNELSPGKKLPDSLSERARMCSSVSDFVLPRYDSEDIQKIEKSTQGQEDSPLRVHYGIGSVRASLFKRVAARMVSLKEPNILRRGNPKLLIRKLMGYEIPNPNHPTFSWSQASEQFAKQDYLAHQESKGHEGIQVEDCGIFFHPEKTFLEASPNGIVSCPCSSCAESVGRGILIIKCPISSKSEKPSPLNEDFLTETSGKPIQLSKDHDYYSEIQTQLAVTESPWCDFFVYKPGGTFLQRILPDLERWTSDLSQAEQFFWGYIVPELVDRKLQKHLMGTQDVQAHHERLQSATDANPIGFPSSSSLSSSSSSSSSTTTTEPPLLDDKLSLSQEPAVSSSVGAKLCSSQVNAAVPPGVHPDPHMKETHLSTPSKTTSSEELQYEAANRDRLSKICCEGVFGQIGGEMTISSHTLNIPAGALISDTRITIKILQDVPDSVHLRADEVIATYVFQCLPSGLRFADGKPVRLTIPHCVKLIDPKRVQTVLYYWSHDEKGDIKVKPERIVQTTRTCRVTPHNIEICLEHFSVGFLAFIKSWFYTNGKLMSFMPFLPRKLPKSRKVMMELRMVNKPPGTSWKDIHELDKNARYQPAKDDDDELVVKEKDLRLSCQTEDSTPVMKDVTSVALFTTTKQTVYFDLNLKDKSDDSLVTLKLKQDKTETEIQFRTHYCDDAESENSSSEEDALEGTSVRRPSESTSENEVTESDVDRLVDELGDNPNVEKVARKLGFNHFKWRAYRKTNKDGNLDGTRCMIFDWKKKTSKQQQRPILRKALEDAGLKEASEFL